MTRLPLVLAGLCIAGAAAPAHASEVFGGIFAHDVNSPLTASGEEDGVDVQLGWRGSPIGRTPLQPYLFGSVNTAGETHYAAAGISAKFGDKIFIRPGLGLAVHSGSSRNFDDPTDDEVEFGSRILFAPELGIGAELTERLTIEASIVHLSHAQIFGRQNPGIDNIGVRLTFDLP